MWIIVGLGNPGSQYEGTRHNLGFDIVDHLADRLKITFKAGKGDYYAGSGEAESVELLLVKPVTYMNNSGEAVVDVADRFKVPPHHILVVCDEFQLPLGTVRLRARGSDGGHNGLYSIIYHLQSEDFPRLRCGIARSSLPEMKSMLSRYVLDPFAEGEREIVNLMIPRASEAALFAVTNGIDEAMNRYNVDPIGPIG